MSRSAKSYTLGLNTDSADAASGNGSTASMLSPLSLQTASMVTATSGSSSTRSILLILVSDFACEDDILHHPLDTVRV